MRVGIAKKKSKNKFKILEIIFSATSSGKSGLEVAKSISTYSLQYHRFITITLSPSHHHYHPIIITPSPSRHHHRSVTIMPSPSLHHYHCITITQSSSLHQQFQL